jgi:pSer/pThr/pTyr-binding forkhead associated (FHA) protein
MPTPVFQLTMQSGPTPGKTFPIEKEETLAGRDLANDITTSEPEVSRRHARFLVREEGVYVEDLGSTNGTFLNGQRISSPQQLRVGDVITFGENVHLVFENYVEEEDVTGVTPEIEKTPLPVVKDPEPVVESYQVPPAYEQARPEPQSPVYEQEPEPVARVKERRRGMPTWLVILLVAIVMLICIIAVTMYFMPASWWCAIDVFNLLEGCPIQ